MKKTKELKKLLAVVFAGAIAVTAFAGCGESGSSSGSSSKDSSTSGKLMSNEEIIKKAAADGKVGNWGLGNEYEILALLQKYDLPTKYLSEDFTMDGFDQDDITLASAMTFNELGLVKNDYDGGYKYGDTVGTIDMNDEGVAMLEDNIFCTKEFAKKNPNTVKAFLYASMKGWAYAVENPEEAAQIVFDAGSSVSSDHQLYMAKEVAKLVTTDTKGKTVSNYGNMDEDAMQQTLDLCKKYVQLDDSSASKKLEGFTLDDIRDIAVFPTQIDDREHFVEKFSRRADERLALQILIFAGALAHEQHLRVLWADAEDDMVPRLRQRTPRAGQARGLQRFPVQHVYLPYLRSVSSNGRS